MRKIGLILGCAAFVAACNQAPQEYVLTGKIENCTVPFGVIGLAERGLGDTVRIAADGTFTYHKQVGEPQSSFLVLEGQPLFVQLLLIDGTTTQLTADPTTGAYRFDGDLKESYSFYKRTQESLNAKSDPSVYDSFRKHYGALIALRDSIDRAVRVLNSDFQALQMREVDEAIDMYCIPYCSYLKEKGLAVDSDPDYNRYMESLDLNNPKYLHDGYTRYYFDWRRQCLLASDKEAWLRVLRAVPQKVTNIEVRDDAVLAVLYSYFGEGGDLSIDAVCTEAAAIVQDSARRAWIARNCNALKKIVPGAEAPDCEWTDAQGQVSRFSDLRGKVVYLDVWATWCGPCCEEIPFMEEVAAHFQNDPRIEIVSVSVDSRRNDWLEKIREDQPVWKQFLYKDFCDLYGITGIPRFILIAAAGKIITVNAPRPSDSGIIGFIEGYLK